MEQAQLVDILIFKRHVLQQFLAVASIFGGFAVTGVVALRADAHRDRVHALAFGAMATAAIAFIFATALDAVWLPLSNLERLRTISGLQTLLDIGESVVWAIIVGAVSLVIAVGLFGFARSRQMGIFVLVVTTIAAVIFVLNVLALARIS